MSNPFFSVIIPVYNRENLIDSAIESVLRQSFSDYELIVVDDGSTDRSLYHVGKSADKLLRLEHSGMAGLVRNRGAELASGKFLAFLDSDDLWLEDKLALQYELLQKNKGLKLVHTREIWIRNGREISQKSQKHKREGDIFEDALWKCIIGPSTTVIDREVFLRLGGFREDLEVAEDYELWLRYCSDYEVGYIDTPCTVKQAGEWDQLSAKYEMIENFRIDALFSLVKSNYFNIERQQLAKKVLIKKLEIYLNGCLKRNKNEEAAEIASKIKELT
ncbi:MAG: glycosyltransferase family 2 protein [Spirochaetales bacterium]|nr:glycosyltransferase family 2 protein [Spirochaetales bacterium]